MVSFRYSILSFFVVSIVGIQVSSTFAATETNPDFSYQTFATCSEFENTLKQILPTTYNDGRMYK